MHYNFFHTLRKLYQGQSVARIMMNLSLSKETLKGAVLDVGGGRYPDYFDYFKKSENVSIEIIDFSLSGIDFEHDEFPNKPSTVDTVIMCNVLEHVYHYNFLLNQVYKVLRSEGKLIGFVPFWVGYHPDPHDYFRYTLESITLILSEAGFKGIKITSIGGSPIIANFNTIGLSIPRVLRPILYILYKLLDLIFLNIRPKSAKRNPLGFKFVAYV